ncbi:MAG: hypothetical protein J6B89_02655 [Bacilli bacterium]|nr:hypothetical protein [Bacilli bacterium]
MVNSKFSFGRVFSYFLVAMLCINSYMPLIAEMFIIPYLKLHTQDDIGMDVGMVRSIVQNMVLMNPISSCIVSICLAFMNKKKYLLDQRRSRHKLYDLSAKLNEQDILVSPTALQTSTVIEEKVIDTTTGIDSSIDLNYISNTTYFYLSDTDKKIRILKEVRNVLKDSRGKNTSTEEELFLLDDGEDMTQTAKTLKLK